MANTNPLWKQLLGAVVGSAVAVVLYLGYQSTEPLRAYLIPPGYKTASSAMSGTGVRLATTQLIDREHRLNDRAERVASRLREYREKGMVAVAPSGRSSQASSWMASSEEASSAATSSGRHRLPPAPAGAWLDQQWSSEAAWSSEPAWHTSSTQWVAAASVRSSAAKYANPQALPGSGAAMMTAMMAGIGGMAGLGMQRWRRSTLRA